MQFRHFVTLSVFALWTLGASAVPALRKPRTVTEADGSTLTLRQVGDEFLHYTIDTHGDVVTVAPDGFYYLAKVDDHGLTTPSAVRASAAAASPERLAVATNIADISTERIRAERIARRTTAVETSAATLHKNAAASQTNPYSGVGRTRSAFPTEGDVRSCVILVEYADYPFQTPDASEFFTDMLNGDNFTGYGGTGSARSYFLKSSDSKFRPTFDVYGPVKLPRERAYYGGNDAKNNDMNPEDMLVHAVQILDDTVDFSLYDMDGDGRVDNIFVIYAGQGEASYGPAESVWPHAWSLGSAGKTMMADGKIISSYGCSNEWKINTPDGVGTFIHEFSHVIGLPDLYCTTYSDAQYETPSKYSVLDYGPYNNDGRTPPIYSSYERNAMGWLEPVILGEQTTIALPNLEDSMKAALIPTSLSNEYFLLENRQQSGWDTYIPGHGMLVWHIDYNYSIFEGNNVNNTSGHQYVDIIEACGSADNYSLALMEAYPFPGTGNVTELGAETIPALRLWDNSTTGVEISNIAEDSFDGLITFDVNGGDNSLDTPLCHESADVDAGGFTAVWSPVEAASDYLLRVTAVAEHEAATETADMGQSSDTALLLPEGWRASSTDVYTDPSNCAGAVPSYKMKTDGAWIESRSYPGLVTSLSFSMRGIGASGSTLSVLGLADDGWQDISVLTPDYKLTTVEIKDIPAGIHAIRLIYNRQKGNLAIDDITVGTGSREYVLPGYNFVSTGGATRMRVNAAEGISRYRYTVRATDGTRRSPQADEVEVILPQSSVDGIEADPADAPAGWFDLGGRSLGSQRPSAPGVYILRQGSSASRVLVRP